MVPWVTNWINKLEEIIILDFEKVSLVSGINCWRFLPYKIYEILSCSQSLVSWVPKVCVSAQKHLSNGRGNRNPLCLDAVSNFRFICWHFQSDKHQLICPLLNFYYTNLLQKSCKIFTAFEAVSWTLLYMSLRIWEEFDWNISRFICFSPLIKSCDNAFNFFNLCPFYNP